MPGVPLDGIDNLKRAFKGLFKRGKKSKTGTPTTTTSATPSQPPQSASGSEAAAPQLPPIQNNSPLTATDTSKPLPPTHPLATGYRDEPTVAVPLKQDAQPGPPAPVVESAGTAEQMEEQRREETTSPVSPPETHSVLDGARSGDVSAVTEDASPQEPAKTDSGIEEVKMEEPAVAPSQPPINAENVDPNTSITPSEDKAASSPTVAAASAPNGTPTPVPGSDEEREAAPSSQEENVSVIHDEPPPIQSAKPAPGMSATSGPLEDFPEGGDMRYD